MPRISLVATATGWRMEVRDLLISYRLTVTFEHVEDWLAALEAGLDDPNANWEPIAQGEGAQKRRSLETRKLDRPEDDI